MDPQTARDRLADDVQHQFNEMVESGQINSEKLPPRPGQKPEEPAPIPTESDPTPQEKAPSAKVEPLLAEKYKSVPDLEQGYTHLLTQTGVISQENAQLREQLAATQATPVAMPATQLPGGSPGADPRVDPLNRSSIDWKANGAVMKFSESTGLDPSIGADLASSIYDSVVQGATAAATRAAQDAVAPIHSQNQADAYMHQKHPEAFKFTQELQTYLGTADPTVKATFKNLVDANNFSGASEYLWFAYKQSSGKTVQSQLLAQAKETEPSREQAKAQAGVSSSSPGTPIHESTAQSEVPTNEEIAILAQRAMKGDIHDQKAYREATTGRMLKNDPNFQKMLQRHEREFGLSRG